MSPSLRNFKKKQKNKQEKSKKIQENQRSQKSEKVRKKEDVFEHLKWLSNNIESSIELGKKNELWFNKNNGIELAKKWIDLYNTE